MRAAVDCSDGCRANQVAMLSWAYAGALINSIVAYAVEVLSCVPAAAKPQGVTPDPGLGDIRAWG
jgi:hypothetical protein